MSEAVKLTPLMEQYFNVKQEHSDGLVLFQVGDFFELFFEDAVTASQALSITLTKRGKCNGVDIPICGVPLSSATYHVAKLVKQGFKVIVCEQVSKPVPGEIVDRAVTRILTPGTLTDDLMLDQKKASFLCSLWPIGSEWSLIFAELLGEKIFATNFSKNEIKVLDSELYKFFPDEVILPDVEEVIPLKNYLTKQGFFVNLLKQKDDSSTDNNSAFGELKANSAFEPFFVKEYFLDNFKFFFSYLNQFHKNFLSNVSDVCWYKPDDYVVLDSATIKNLEIFRSLNDASIKGSLFEVLDLCQTGMGSRALRHSLAFPLKKIEEINARLFFVELLKSSFMRLCTLENLLKGFPDLARIAGRLALDKSIFSDLLQLRDALAKAISLKKFLETVFEQSNNLFLSKILPLWPTLDSLHQLLQRSLSSSIQDSFKIAAGFSRELDELRSISGGQKDLISALEKSEQMRTGITNLKIKYTDIQGYFVEVSANNISKVPSNYKLLQTLVGRSRYIFEDLSELAAKISLAQLELVDFEDKLIDQIFFATKDLLNDLRKVAYLVGQVDMLFGLAKVAYNNNYSRPEFIDGSQLLKISSGRHPVVEFYNSFLFTPNDTFFDQSQNCMILTGPNMGGKSTFLRQNAIITLMAHIGSFVPAQRCELSVVDRIFTRIGSGDNLSAGKSTFLVEMEEVATICSYATNKSLIILDEVGRGTSTFDGMALAKAILEYLHDYVGGIVFFATHYHELASLSEVKSGIKNYFMDCLVDVKNDDNLIFLHKIKQGCSKASFGIEVAKLAGLNPQILKRAKVILGEFEK